jgi:hypothetical protein
MATMEGFDQLLNWKLKAGSRPFPGKDGGTCINEAARSDWTKPVGEVAKWVKAAVLKTAMGASPPWVLGQ